MKILLSFLMIVNSSFLYAESAVSLKKGDAAPFEGLLLTNEKANELRRNTLFLQTQLEINDSLKKSVELYKEREAISDSQLQKALDVNNKMSQYIQYNDNKYEKFLWFGLGVLATGLAIHGAKEILK